MRISELSEVTGVSVATVKFYIREGMLPRGEATSATSAEYGDAHVARLKLIAALIESSQLSLANVKRILALVDNPIPNMMETFGEAIAALPPYAPELPAYPLAEEAIRKVGFNFEPGFAATWQLEQSIKSLKEAGLPWTDRQIEMYATIGRQIASVEIPIMMETPPDGLVEFAVLGTALYEPIILAMRRLAHEQITREIAMSMYAHGGRSARFPDSMTGASTGASPADSAPHRSPADADGATQHDG